MELIMNCKINSEYVAWLRKGNIVTIGVKFRKFEFKEGRSTNNGLEIPDEYFEECIDLLCSRGLELDLLDFSDCKFKVV